MRWILTTLVVVALIAAGYMLFRNGPSASSGEVPADAFADPSALLAQVQAGGVVLVDVREQEEWDAGHIAGAQLLPLGDINAESAGHLPKDKPVYLYCHSGRRAGLAESTLRSLGFTNVHNVGGTIDWEAAGGALVR